jgi:hypothetical protein
VDLPSAQVTHRGDMLVKDLAIVLSGVAVLQCHIIHTVNDVLDFDRHPETI